MKKFTSIAIAFFLVLSFVPAMAADQAGSDREPVTSQASDKAPLTFQAFNNLSATEREAITPLTETELESIEGSSSIGACVACFILNVAIVPQVNNGVAIAVGVGVSPFSSGAAAVELTQTNAAVVTQ